MVRHIGLVILALSVATVSGCHVGCCSKRASEKKCPTDVRKMHCWCWGEDALFRYPCGPNRVYYGHKATCWREWPSSGSEWRDAHCGPPMMHEQVPYDPQVMPPLETTAPAPGPAAGEIPNPFRGDEGQAPLPPQTQLPAYINPGDAEPSAVPPTYADYQPAVPPVADAAPQQPIRQVPISSNSFPPMAEAESAQSEFQTWPVSAEADATRVESREVAAQDSVIATVGVTHGPAAELASAPMTGQTATVSDVESQWRLVIHDQVEDPTPSNPDAPLFRPPRLDRPQSPATPPMRHPAARKPSLEERTGAALRRFMSWEMPPGATR
jgi:hypothetical protein